MTPAQMWAPHRLVRDGSAHCSCGVVHDDDPDADVVSPRQVHLRAVRALRARNPVMRPEEAVAQELRRLRWLRAEPPVRLSAVATARLDGQIAALEWALRREPTNQTDRPERGNN
jgi:hypothetical protein